MLSVCMEFRSGRGGQFYGDCSYMDVVIVLGGFVAVV